jgi:hypothetical protein
MTAMMAGFLFHPPHGRCMGVNGLPTGLLSAFAILRLFAPSPPLWESLRQRTLLCCRRSFTVPLLQSCLLQNYSFVASVFSYGFTGQEMTGAAGERIPPDVTSRRVMIHDRMHRSNSAGKAVSETPSKAGYTVTRLILVGLMKPIPPVAKRKGMKGRSKKRAKSCC